MEFLIVLVPGALLVEAAWLALYVWDRRLVRVVRERHRDVLTALRGRERRWYDMSEELWVQQPVVRRQLRGLLDSRLAGDAELAIIVARVDRGEWWLRRATWLAVGCTALLIVALVARYQLTGGG